MSIELPLYRQEKRNTYALARCGGGRAMTIPRLFLLQALATAAAGYAAAPLRVGQAALLASGGEKGKLAARPTTEGTIDAAVRHAMKTWSVPGAAVVIVRDDRVVYCKGHGLRRAGTDDPVTADTLFAISSCSKAFTTAAMALLADEGKLGWDDRVRKHLPWFRLSDPLVSEEVRLRDLVCHRTGLAAHELLWHGAPWSPEEAVRRLRFLPLARPFRTALQYQSTAFTAAGLAAASAAGCPWTELVRKRLLAPLGMTATCLSYPEAARSADLASPHALDRAGDAVPVPRLASPFPDPAISVHTSARELGVWLRFHLAGGLAGGKRLVSARALAQTHTPQIPIRLSLAQQTVFPDTVQLGYAMGWAVHDHAGVKLVSHGGAIDGFRTHLAFAPDRRVGVAVLCNLQGTPMPLALAATLMGELLGLPRRDWHALHKKLRDRLRADAEARRRALLASRRHGTRPSRELAAYAGDYEHPAYGKTRVGLSRGRLVWRWRGEDVPLEHFHHDSYLLSSGQFGDAEATFTLDESGAVAELHVTGGLGVTFRRAAPPRKTP
jgi:CubicO group peptidase (beta-lactamase class C family)